MAGIICHPHPLFGGDRFNHVVTALFDALPTAGIAALRFDFRSEFSGGPGERLDAIAAIDEVAAAVPGVPIVALGYSFGALIALGLGDDRVAALVLVAPPLAMGPQTAAPSVPALVLTPRHDQFSPPATSDPIVEAWAEHGAVVQHHTIEMADHSLVGHVKTVTAEIVTWLAHLA
jgi:alpha/beta superfamily hydrolase